MLKLCQSLPYIIFPFVIISIKGKSDIAPIKKELKARGIKAKASKNLKIILLVTKNDKTLSALGNKKINSIKTWFSNAELVLIAGNSQLAIPNKYTASKQINHFPVLVDGISFFILIEFFYLIS